MALHKDDILASLARSGNVAQFVSYRWDGELFVQSHSSVRGFSEDYDFGSLEAAARILLLSSPERKINIRSYDPDSPRSHEFVYGIDSESVVIEHASRLGNAGLNIILNETIDVADGGVSGVAHGDILEFAPDDTPRCVEKAGALSIHRKWGVQLLELVYGFSPALPGSECRTEFSIHPLRRGQRDSHTVLWEMEMVAPPAGRPAPSWPNKFSRHVGDKAFGLLVAHILGERVPRTTVIPRRVAPFIFGVPTGSNEKWIRTCPKEPEPGLFTTLKGWTDPFRLLALEDPTNERIASVLSQDGVPAVHSGAALEDLDGKVFIEGKEGEGDSFMLGVSPPEPLPQIVVEKVSERYQALRAVLGPVRFEWVHDGDAIWIVQLHKGATVSTQHFLVPGEPKSWIDFDVRHGLEALRRLYASLPSGAGVNLIGEVGITSHIADVARKAGRPAKLEAR